MDYSCRMNGGSVKASSGALEDAWALGIHSPSAAFEKI